MGEPRILLVEASGRGFLNHYSHALGMGLHSAKAQVRLLSGVRDELSAWDVPFEKHSCIQRGRKGWSCVKQQVMQFQPDIVHFQWVDNPFSALRLVKWLQRRGIKTIYTPHNLLPHEKRWMLMPLYRLLYRAMDKVIARDQHIAWALEELLDVNSHQVEFIPGSPNLLASVGSLNCDDESCYARKLEHEKRLLFFGHGSRRKGLDQLLDIIQQHDWPTHYHLVLAGEGVMSSVNGDCIMHAREKMKITLIDQYIPPEKVAQLFSSADILLMPYTKQCKSPLLDLAAALKLPVVKSDRVKGAEFREGMHGVTFKQDDAIQMLDYLLNEDWLDSSRAYLQSQVSTEQMMAQLATQHLKMYRGVLQCQYQLHDELKLQQQSSGISI